MLAAENWCVKVDDRVYGPYTTAQMRKYAHQGRLAPWSLIAPAGGREWREARAETVFADFFGRRREPRAAPARPCFGRRRTGNAGQEDQPVAPPRRAPVHNRAQAAEDAGPNAGPANFIIVFDVVSGAASRVEPAVLSLGAGFRIADNVWSLACELTAVGVRNAIAPYLAGRESLFVVDATRGRTSWQHYAPELHAKISTAYVKSRPPAPGAPRNAAVPAPAPAAARPH